MDLAEGLCTAAAAGPLSARRISPAAPRTESQAVSSLGEHTSSCTSPGPCDSAWRHPNSHSATQVSTKAATPTITTPGGRASQVSGAEGPRVSAHTQNSSSSEPARVAATPPPTRQGLANRALRNRAFRDSLGQENGRGEANANGSALASLASLSSPPPGSGARATAPGPRAARGRPAERAPVLRQTAPLGGRVGG